MAADLGTWPAEQATVLLEVLHTAGLHPEARRARDGVHVIVPDDEGDQAHATLVAQMDTIAQAARPSSPNKGRRLRAVEDPAGTRGPKRAAKAQRSERRPQRAGTASEARRFGRPAALVIAGFVLAVIIGPPTSTFVLAVTIGAVVWLLGKQAQRGG
ncbi:MAG: hypothetical protein WEB03_11795 [Nitriliruptor sp.]|uniref:hypothetical protein n=1 Tax=Nitriliruptor sp. TaxID=2448056 RepID=UPI0034A0A914